MPLPTSLRRAAQRHGRPFGASVFTAATLSAAATSHTTSALAAPTAPATPAASSAISSTEHCFHHAGN